MDEIESELHIQLHPLSWPINMGREFKGVYNLYDKELLLFRPNQKVTAEDTALKDLNDPSLPSIIGEKNAKQLKEDAELIEGVYGSFDQSQYLKAEIAPVFFGSAINNFGVKELLETFIRIAPIPQEREVTTRIVKPSEEKFSGFVFKIHANLDPRHRDRIAFLRVCSGKFERNKYFHHVRLNKDIRFSNPYSFLAREKDVIDAAYPGDVVGLYDSGNFKIGDTLTEGEDYYYTGIPSFSPEIFKEVVNKDPMKTKQLARGFRIDRCRCGAVFTNLAGNKRIIGCVGELQFEVIHTAQTRIWSFGNLVPLPYYQSLWIIARNRKNYRILSNSSLPTSQKIRWQLVYLAQSNGI